MMLIISGLFGLTLRFDYWSNGVELLAAVCVYSWGHLGISHAGGLALGALLGLGRETLPLLILTGVWPIALGAAATQGILMATTRQGEEWGQSEQVFEHGWSQLRRNLAVTISRQPWPTRIYVSIYWGIGLLAIFTAPLLAVALIALTFWRAKIDEPRVLTMLVPYAAGTLCALAT